MNNMHSDWVALVTSLLPILIITIPLLIVFAFILRRKGRSPFLSVLLLIPLIGQLYALYIVSLTDRDVLDRLERLETMNG